MPVIDSKVLLNKIKEAKTEIDDLDRYYDNSYNSSNNEPMFKCEEVIEILNKLISDFNF